MFEIPLLIVALVILVKFSADQRRGLADIANRFESQPNSTPSTAATKG